MSTKEIIKKTAFAGIFILFVFSMAEPCSVCLCGDDMYLYGHRHQLMNGKFSLSLENRIFSKSSGPAELVVEPGVNEKAHEVRPTLTIAYGATENLTLAANMSNSFKRLEEITDQGSEIMSNSGFGDMQFEAMWNTRFSQNLAGSYIFGALLTIKAPTGSNDKINNGTRVDEHSQTGTGTWDFKSGLGLSKFSSKFSRFVSIFYQTNGTNKHAYHYGNSFLFNAGGEFHLTEKFSITGDINGRYAGRDKEDGQSLQNSGGWVYYMSPGLRYNFTPSAGIVTSVQIPVYEDLYENQNENVVLNLAFRFDIL